MEASTAALVRLLSCRILRAGSMSAVGWRVNCRAILKPAFGSAHRNRLAAHKIDRVAFCFVKFRELGAGIRPRAGA